MVLLKNRVIWDVTLCFQANGFFFTFSVIILRDSEAEGTTLLQNVRNYQLLCPFVLICNYAILKILSFVLCTFHCTILNHC